MRYVFGPVPSRRLGRSLGIDPVPLKTCNWNCVYCQLGATEHEVAERAEWVPREEIMSEVREALAGLAPGSVDWVTFVGSGETTLHSGLGAMVRGVKALTDVPVAVMTNGSLLGRPEVRDDLSAADAVLCTLDAGDVDTFRRIHRPAHRASLEDHIAGIEGFARAYRRRLWCTVMLVRGLNDGEPALRAIADALARILPEEVHINLPVRPPAERWVEPVDPEGLARARRILGEAAHVVPPFGPPIEPFSGKDIAGAIEAIVRRHPMSERELFAAFSRQGRKAVEEALAGLAAGDRVRPADHGGTRFWVASAERRRARAAPSR